MKRATLGFKALLLGLSPIGELRSYYILAYDLL